MMYNPYMMMPQPQQMVKQMPKPTAKMATPANQASAKNTKMPAQTQAEKPSTV
jgi:hypothetical protein